jgi:hypothetical protein
LLFPGAFGFRHPFSSPARLQVPGRPWSAAATTIQTLQGWLGLPSREFSSFFEVVIAQESQKTEKMLEKEGRSGREESLS